MVSPRASASRPTKSVPMVDDSDLDDLLVGGGGGGHGGSSNGKAGDSTETAPLNLDHLTQGKLDVPHRQTRLGAMTCWEMVTGYGNYLCYQYSSLCWCLGLGLFVCLVVILANTMMNPTEVFGVVRQDLSSINDESQFAKIMGGIDHWCLQGGNDKCRCDDPLVPQSRFEFKPWSAVHQFNKNQVKAYEDSDLLDVAFLGESLVEEMDGHWLQRNSSEELQQIKSIFRKRFKRDAKADIAGVALGIAGDTCPNVLWRLQHGEMIEKFNPKVWWVALGMNDLGRSQCSEDIVVIGILRVVEEIMTKKPNAKIVINSLLPMADLRGGIYPLTTDFQDAFRPLRGHRNAPPIPESRYVPKQVKSDNEEKAENKGTADAATPKAEKKSKDAKSKDRKKGRKKDRSSVKKGNDTARRLSSTSERSLGRRRKEGDPSDDEERRRKRMRFHKMHRDPYNPKIDPFKTKMKKYDAHKLFLKKNRLPLWASITAINKQLEDFSEKHKDRVHYFDAGPIFTNRDEGGKVVLSSDLISIRGHPTVEGFERWEDGMVKKLKSILPKNQNPTITQATLPPAKEASSSKPAESEGSSSKPAEGKGDTGE